MSVESEILRIQRNVANTYAKVAEKGGTVPTQPTSANLAAAVASIPAGGSSGGTPIGTVISFMGTTAPKDYLICDGATYGITAYPELASFFAAQFGASNHFGGDGTTTFAVPDLRNLFLRGYHGESEDQLSGEIGAKQEATQHLNMFTGVSNVTAYPNGNYFTGNADTFAESVSRRLSDNDRVDSGNRIKTHYTSRPVNMAVLYCIKAISSASPINLPENTYSTEETRIGTWIDGKPLYRRVVQETIPSTGAVTEMFDTSSWNIDKLAKLLGVSQAATDGSKQKIPFSSFGNFYGWIGGSGYFTVAALTTGSKLYGCPMTIVFEYTKTTDAASEVISTDQPIANTVSAEQDQAGQG